MERTLELEVMDDDEQVLAYAAADFSASNQMFVDGFVVYCTGPVESLLDIGCGSADIPIRLARAKPSVRITAVDASDAMLCVANRSVQEAGLVGRIELVKGRVPGLALADRHFDAIVSKDLLHHLPDPMVFWEEVKRLVRRPTVVYVMDLFRPETAQDAKNIVESVSANEPEVLKRDFYNSLLAAFTVDEVAEQMLRAGLELEVAAVSERHMLTKGVLA
jgi:ubiquinone/menaquinone biosynthesis C-methylase UbiE